MAVTANLRRTNGAIYNNDWEALSVLANTLGVKPTELVRHAVRLGMAALTEDVDVDGDTIDVLDAAAGF